MDEELPTIEFAFPGPLRDRLIAAILAGMKTSTSSLLREYEVAAEPLPVPGQRGRVVDSAGRPVCVLETTAVAVVRLAEVTLEHARAEGEGFTSVAEWRAGHERFWRSQALRAELGTDEVLDDDTLIVVETFVLVRRLADG